jgi:integrase
MAVSGMKLTVKHVAKALKHPGRYGDGNGLYLQVMTAGRGSWLLRFERNGRERAMGLGSTADFSLAEARQRARAARQLLADGVDPLEQRRAERAHRAAEAAKSVTFKQVAEQYAEAHAAEWNNRKHREQFINTLKAYAYPTIAALPVSAVDEPLILKILTPIWKQKTVTAKRVRNRIASVLDYAAAAKLRTGTNPARWEGHLEHLLPKPEKVRTRRHHAALPYREVASFMTQLRGVDGVAARALEFLALTASRTGEVVGAQWCEIDLGEQTWTVPPERMKAGKEHRVPLSDRAIELLKALPREAGNENVFIGVTLGSSISSNSMYRVMKRLRSDAVVHGFRSTFRTWADEQTSYPHHVVEQALAHTIGSAVERAYRRGDLFEKRAKLMQAWAAYCSAPIKTSAVVPIRERVS